MRRRKSAIGIVSAKSGAMAAKGASSEVGEVLAAKAAAGTVLAVAATLVKLGRRSSGKRRRGAARNSKLTRTPRAASRAKRAPGRRAR
jgi:hypothetical protein